MPIPVKITPAGGYTCIILHPEQVKIGLYWAYQADTPTDGCGEIIEDIHSRIEPFGAFIIARLVKPRDLFSNGGEDGISGIAGFKFSK